MAETKLGLQAAVMDGAEKHESTVTPLQSEAHAWIRRLVSGEATETDAVALRRWCGQSPAHAAAFSEASQFWNAFGPAGRSLLREQDVATGPAASLNPRLAMGRRAFVGGALAASAAALLVTRPPFGLWPSWSELKADYRTSAGEQRRVVMSDGVAIRLNTRTSISTRIAGDAGAVELIAGEASFTALGHLSRPFRVIAAGGKAEADNAQFDVRRFDWGARVTCLADEVRVEYQDRTVTLGSNQRVTYSGKGFEEIAPVDPAVVTAWQHGLLIFNMTPLADVVEELNRYRVGRIVLLNNAVGQRPVNGRFRIDQPDEALLQIERAFGVRGRSLPGGFVLLS
jgi:transmembrane sensor